jgi:hypothetical protein
MTRPSRGISNIQDKARGKSDMVKTKAGMFPLKKKDTIKAKVIKRGAPTPDLAQLGAMRSAKPAGFKCGGSTKGFGTGGGLGMGARGSADLERSMVDQGKRSAAPKPTPVKSDAALKAARMKAMKDEADSESSAFDMAKGKGYANGGSISRGNGCAIKGKTKGAMR